MIKGGESAKKDYYINIQTIFMNMTSSLKQMPTGDLIVNNEENPHHSEGHLIKTEIYKNLRRRSPSLALILTIVLPILLLFIYIACSPRHTILQSSEEVYGIIAFDWDCLAIVLGWLFFQVSNNSFFLRKLMENFFDFSVGFLRLNQIGSQI